MFYISNNDNDIIYCTLPYQYFKVNGHYQLTSTLHFYACHSISMIYIIISFCFKAGTFHLTQGSLPQGTCKQTPTHSRQLQNSKQGAREAGVVPGRNRAPPEVHSTTTVSRATKPSIKLYSKWDVNVREFDVMTHGTWKSLLNIDLMIYNCLINIEESRASCIS